MNKDKILEKVRKENKDEREKKIEMRTYSIGWFSVTLVISILIIVRFLHNQPTDDLLLLVNTQIFARSFYLFWKNKDFPNLFSSFLGLCLILFFGFRVLVQYGWL